MSVSICINWNSVFGRNVKFTATLENCLSKYRRHGSRPSTRKRNAKRQNGCLRRPYKIAEKRRDAKSKGEKEKYTHLNAAVPKDSKER